MGVSKEQLCSNSIAHILSHCMRNPGATVVKEQMGSALSPKDERRKSENLPKGGEMHRVNTGGTLAVTKISYEQPFAGLRRQHTSPLDIDMVF